MISYKELYTKSNLISLLRLLLAVPLWFLIDNLDDEFYRYLTFGICVFGAFTDILDGYLARKYNEVTEAGKIIDPFADKIVIGVIVIKLYLVGIIPSYYFFMIIGRDLLIFIGGIIVSRKLGKVLPSNMLGKITVVSIGIVILFFILGAADKENYLFLSLYALSIILIFASFIGYLIRAIEFINQKKNYESV
ncbi:MAG: CDP-alcohol phosphatidyltransferase family protein [Ignavibacteriaceae bacterium]